MDGEPTALERVLKRDRHIVIGGLVFVSLVSWLYILTGAGMGEIAWATEGAAPSLRLAWTPAYAGPLLAMWWARMVAMMMPSAAPVMLLLAAVTRKTHRPEGCRVGKAGVY